MLTRLNLAAWAVALLVIIIGYVRMDRLADDNRDLKNNLSMAAQTMTSMRLEIEAGQTALLQRDKDVRELAANRDHLKMELDGIYASNCEAAVWADTHMPDDVYQRLRQALPGSAAGNAPGGSPAGRIRPTPGR